MRTPQIKQNTGVNDMSDKTGVGEHHLERELDALRKENETLSKMVSIAAKQREKYLAIEAENRTLKDAWRLTYAGQAMKEHMTALSKASIEDWHDEVARLSFLTADSMIRRISI